jgi:hypothetical protein
MLVSENSLKKPHNIKLVIFYAIYVLHLELYADLDEEDK